MAHRVPVPADVVALGVLDDVGYEDAFAVHAPVRRTAEQWVRLGLEGAPAVLRAFVVSTQGRVLGLGLASPASPRHVLGWTVVSNEPDRIVLGAQGRLCAARLVFSVPPDGTAGDGVLVTLLRFDHVAGRVLWAVIAPIHRAVARFLLDRAVRLAG